MQHIQAGLSTPSQPSVIVTPSEHIVPSKNITSDLNTLSSLGSPLKDIDYSLLESPTTRYDVALTMNSTNGRANNRFMGEVSQSNFKYRENKEEIRSEYENPIDSTQMPLAQVEIEDCLHTPNSNYLNTKSPYNNSKEEGFENPRSASVNQSKDAGQGPILTPLRYSLVPPPAMTDLEFWGAIVKDYNKTAQCLPTLISKKIRAGIPPPLRGVVWQSICGARDVALEETYNGLSSQSISSDNIIRKDLGRIFPGVDMFQDPEGEGQIMLERVLKCFHLYDEKIGFCHRMIYLVGPLLMHMGERQTFCVLVRLMEKYDIRSCFLPENSGLYLRIFQYSQLLKNHIPNLSNHLDSMQVEPTYFSQWILSFFAITCPLPMVLRIYDLIFTEGALETIMRVALSLMRKNEARIINCKDSEGVLQLLNSRGLWDVYHYNADEFVNETMSLSDIVTNQTLKSLEISYREIQTPEVSVLLGKPAQSALRFFDNLCTGSNTGNKLVGGGSQHIVPEQSNEFRRSSSKNSFASTFNSTEGTGSDSMMSSGTDLTSVSIDSLGLQRGPLSYQSVKVKQIRDDLGRNLHNQIESLLTALNGLQKENVMLVKQLSAEREKRSDDRDIILNLLENLRKNMTIQKYSSVQINEAERASISVAHSLAKDTNLNNRVKYKLTVDTEDQLMPLLDAVESHFLPSLSPRSSLLPTKFQLEEELSLVKEQLKSEISKAQDYDRQYLTQSQEIKDLREQIKQIHVHIRSKHTENQRLERIIQELRNERNSYRQTKNPDRDEPSHIAHGYSGSAKFGLRRLRLTPERERQAKPMVFQISGSSLSNASFPPHETKDQGLSPIPSPAFMVEKKKKDIDNENEDLLEKLVQYKTAEAMAREEVEGLRDKVESLKKVIDRISNNAPLSSLSTSDVSNPSNSSPSSLTSNLLGGSKTEIRSSISSISAAISGAVVRNSKKTTINAPTRSNITNSNNSSSFGFVGSYFNGPQTETKVPSTSTADAGQILRDTTAPTSIKSTDINPSSSFGFVGSYFNSSKEDNQLPSTATIPAVDSGESLKNKPASNQIKNGGAGFWSGWGKKVNTSG